LFRWRRRSIVSVPPVWTSIPHHRRLPPPSNENVTNSSTPHGVCHRSLYYPSFGCARARVCVCVWVCVCVCVCVCAVATDHTRTLIIITSARVASGLCHDMPMQALHCRKTLWLFSDWTIKTLLLHLHVRSAYPCCIVRCPCVVVYACRL
jgi:hypothetical protein